MVRRVMRGGAIAAPTWEVPPYAGCPWAMPANKTKARATNEPIFRGMSAMASLILSDQSSGRACMIRWFMGWAVTNYRTKR